MYYDHKFAFRLTCNCICLFIGFNTNPNGFIDIKITNVLLSLNVLGTTKNFRPNARDPPRTRLNTTTSQFSLPSTGDPCIIHKNKNGPVESECKLNSVNPHIIRNQIQNQIEVTLNKHSTANHVITIQKQNSNIPFKYQVNLPWNTLVGLPKAFQRKTNWKYWIKYIKPIWCPQHTPHHWRVYSPMSMDNK